MSEDGYWAVAQCVTKMEHIVRRDIEKTNHGAFLPTCARHWKVDGRQYSKERPIIGGYVFFKTSGRDFAGIPDIHGVYRVLSDAEDGTAIPVPSKDIERLFFAHVYGSHNEMLPPRYTKYYQPLAVTHQRRKSSRKPRASKRIRSSTAQ